MTNASNIREHMKVVGSCGNAVGTVDHVEGDQIKLTKNDPQAGGQHHFIPVAWVASVGSEVKLTKNHMDAMKEWRTEPTAAM
ncbi:MAG: DUF2171 domain-containing protein [Gemmataceae bacterium]|nr:DUF2171 domain-containing protein [Gemmataceae bacterium]